jgi:hypothetical protein
MIDTAIVDGLCLVALATRDLGKRRDLAAPGTAFLTVREDDVSAHGAPDNSDSAILPSGAALSPAMMRNGVTGLNVLVYSLVVLAGA